MERNINRIWTIIIVPSMVTLSMMFLFCAFVVIYRKWHHRNVTIPGFQPSSWSPLGHEWKIQSLLASKTANISEASLQLFNALAQMIGFDKGIFHGYICAIPIVVIWRNDAVEKLLSSSRLITKQFPYTFLLPWLGTGLLTSNGDKWRTRRKLLTPAFHFRILEQFLPVFVKHGEIFTRILGEHENMKAVDIVPLVTMATLDIICETAMGAKVNAQEDNGSEYVKALYVVGSGIMSRIVKPWLWFDPLYNISAEGRLYNRNLKIVKNFTLQVIKERKAEMIANRGEDITENLISSDEMGMKKRQPFLDLLLRTHLENEQLLPIEAIQEEVDTFMFEGHDTTAMGISWALYLIASDLKVQAKIHDELDEIFGDDPERQIRHEDLNRMKYIECCIKEAQRLFPSVPIVARLITEETELCGYKVKANTMAIVNFYALHRDSKVFPDPERFIPERFLAENSQGRPPFAVVPFSAGPRNCIGQKFAQMELKVMVASTLRRFKLRAALQRDELHISSELVIRSRDGLPIYISPRNAN